MIMAVLAVVVALLECDGGVAYRKMSISFHAAASAGGGK
jgi:hypothetical protein